MFRKKNIIASTFIIFLLFTGIIALFINWKKTRNEAIKNDNIAWHQIFNHLKECRNEFIEDWKSNIFWIRKELPNCRRLKSGSVEVEVHYPKMFTQYFDGIIHLDNDTKKGHGSLALDIEANYDYDTVENIINFSLIETGPKYKKSTFNGLEAGLNKVNIPEEDSSWSFYKIPFGNRTIDLHYNAYALPPNQRYLGEKMLKSITFTEVKENLAFQQTRVEECSAYY